MATAAGTAVLAACQPGQAASPQAEPTTGITPTVPAAYQVRVQVRPQDARLGQDENVVIQATFLTSQNRPVAGAQLSAVVFDPAGNIVGGGTGFAFQALPPGARLFLQMSGFDVIPLEKAASTMVSIAPTWQQPGA